MHPIFPKSHSSLSFRPLFQKPPSNRPKPSWQTPVKSGLASMLEGGGERDRNHLFSIAFKSPHAMDALPELSAPQFGKALDLARM